MLGSIPDLLRLLAVPVFGWAAYRDVKTRRVPNRAWVPLAALAVVLLLWDSYTVLTGPTAGRAFLLRVAISLGFVAPLAYGFWLVGGFGGADAKAFMLVAVLFPVYPVYYLPTAALPLEPSALGVFSLTILSNTVLAGVVYPLGIAVSNLARGRFSLAMFIGKPVAVDAVPEEYGRLLETTDGFTRSGLDIDALRMYLQWRGATLAEVQADPDRHRDPDSLPRVPNDPGDGAIVTDGGEPSDARRPSSESRSDGGVSPDTATEFGTAATADPWGAERFLDDIEGSAYGTSPEQLREGLEVLVSEDDVWISPGIPFLVPMFAGLVVSLVYGDVLYALLGLVGVA
ncbi:A24 family peptidase [Haloarcula pellucida]|uniref:Peptidase A24 n=1 Tax=Haloarcula pellucida TaxID=1427151 RepID=A0A830GR32_9EURY|nr:A24 family peptidase [Halomicroarcula pellucida]MBX0349328.1 prepilin peptidase [Halomicroarcula pellucida]GGO00057.1 peptidase A24 [Halomicroarcula pellucida]